jgi:hypothetical protein
MTWKGMVDVERLQKRDVKPGMMPGFGPFLTVHSASERLSQHKA